MSLITAKQEIERGSLWGYVARSRPQIEAALEGNLPTAPPAVETRFNEAVKYAVFPGGKRLRPVLTLLGAELFGGRPETVMNAAAAVEYIHTSSLIFDDLPCMDDSPSRRGKLSLHEKFGEGLATLVAIGFLNQSYQLVTIDGNGSVDRSVRAIREIVECVGPGGMVGGQSVDLMIATSNECRLCSRTKFGGVLNLKTSALVRLSLRLGAILSGGGDKEIAALSDFADALGHAYQISDDLTDMQQDAIAFETGTRESEEERLAAALAKQADRSRAVLNENFSDSAARAMLLELVDYVSHRRT